MIDLAELLKIEEVNSSVSKLRKKIFNNNKNKLLFERGSLDPSDFEELRSVLIKNGVTPPEKNDDIVRQIVVPAFKIQVVP